jgi:hypothetical protein
MNDDELFESLGRVPVPRLLRSLGGLSTVIEDIADSPDVHDPNDKDLLWLSSRLRLVVLVLEQQWDAQGDEG